LRPPRPSAARLCVSSAAPSDTGHRLGRISGLPATKKGRLAAPFHVVGRRNQASELCRFRLASGVSVSVSRYDHSITIAIS
jgi:hypothetical protein